MLIKKLPRLKSTLLLLFIVLILLFSGAPFVEQAGAQSITDPWSPPVNLSQSGSASSPVMVIDEAGMIHVFWVDEYAGYFYSSGDGEAWIERLRVSPPFETYRPKLVLGLNDRVHAFWIDEFNNLYWSRASVTQISSGWEKLGLVAFSVVDFGVEVDTQGRIHLSYIYSEDEEGLAGGVGYRRSSTNGETWTEPEFLFQSPYIRGLTAENANVELASTGLGEGSRVYTSWDNRARKQIYLARSVDGGSTWDDPILVDGPDPADPNTVPYNLHIAAFEEKALAVWQRGLPEGGCSVYYRESADGGNTWGERQRMLENYQGCPEEINFIGAGDGYAILQATYLNQVLLLAWDGTKWSEPQLQSQLSSLEDPETFGVIDFACRRFIVNPINEMIAMIGCDSVGGDVWFLEREIGDTSTWYPSPAVWAGPLTVSTASTEFGTPILVGGQDEMMHAFWSQPGEGSTTNTRQSGIYYARWDGERWSRPSLVLNSDEGNASQPDAVLDQNNNLMAVWVGRDTSLVYFSEAAASQALRGSDWSIPVPLTTPIPSVRSPKIIKVGASQVYVTYAVPLNEARGIYMTASGDSGTTWSQPLQVFNAAKAGWDMVDDPILTRAEDGSLHMLFTRYSFLGGSGPLGMYYTRSEDGGETWSEAEVVEENPVYWSRIVSGREGVLHRIWLARTSNSSGFFIPHQYSPDSGYTWSPAENISNLNLSGPSVITSLAVTSTEVMHLLHTNQNLSGEISLNHWVWSGDQWVSREDLMLDMTQVQRLNSLSAAASPTGRVGVIFSAPSAGESSQSIPETELLFSIRALDITIPPAAPLPTHQTSPTPGPALEPTMTPTPVRDLSVLMNQAPPAPTTSRWATLGIGLSLAGILVVASLGIAVLKRRR